MDQLMTNNPSIVQQIREEIESRGYKKLADVPIATRGDVWYCHERSTEDATHVLELTYKPKLKAYGVHVGVFNLKARALIEQWMPSLQKFLDPIVLERPYIIGRPCWNCFDAGRGLKWSGTYNLPDPNDRDGWLARVDHLFADFIEPIFFPIRDAQGVQNLLFKTEAPFEWFAADGVLRVSEIVALAWVAGNVDAHLREQLLPFKRDVERYLIQSEIKDYEALLDFLLSRSLSD